MLKIQVLRLLVCTAYLTILTSCSSVPARWAFELEQKTECGMMLGELEELSPVSITAREVPSEKRGSHQSEKDSFGTYMRLWFGTQGLEKVQVLKEYFLKRVTAEPVTNLCDESGMTEN